MKFYVASIVENKQAVKELIKKLEDKGHTVTRDWTKEKHVIRPYHLNPNHSDKGFEKVKLKISRDEIFKESQEIAEKDIAAVLEADV
ncbi:MAG: hypothetical protein Q8N98_04535, partial [bacterium]|nr:hypothetical protein [bacterium]